MNAVEAEWTKLQDRVAGYKIQNKLDECYGIVADARERIQQKESLGSECLPQLASSMKECQSAIASYQKEMYNGMNRFAKVLEKTFKADLSLIDSSHPFAGKEALINRTIALHLIRAGEFELAQGFMNESGQHIDPEVISEFENLYSIRRSIENKDLLPAISWASQIREELEKRGSTLEFDLHRLQFIQCFIGPEGSAARALVYARTYFPPFGSKDLPEIQRLMGSFLYMHDLKNSPYADIYYSADAWVNAEASFTRECSTVLGFSVESPLSIVLNAGAIALPTLMKMSAIMKQKRTEWTSEGELPVEIALPEKYQFHSIFTCPVSKEQTTELNPPMMMPCGHVIAKESLGRLSKGSSQRFKCPYCPMEATSSNTQRLIF